MGGPATLAPAGGEDVRAAWHRHLPQDDGRVDGAVRGAARSFVSVDEEGGAEFQSLSSEVIGTDDTSVKVLDRKLPFARIGRIWPYVGDAHHPVIVYDYTPTRSRAGPAKFLEDYKGYLQRLALRTRISARLLEKLHKYLLELKQDVLPKSPAAAAVRYALNQWEALTRFLEDGDLEIDNGASERANRDIALGRGNWTFFGSDKCGQNSSGSEKFYCFL